MSSIRFVCNWQVAPPLYTNGVIFSIPHRHKPIPEPPDYLGVFEIQKAPAYVRGGNFKCSLPVLFFQGFRFHVVVIGKIFLLFALRFFAAEHDFQFVGSKVGKVGFPVVIRKKFVKIRFRHLFTSCGFSRRAGPGRDTWSCRPPRCIRRIC